MYKIMSKRYLAENILSMDIKAPRIAEKAMPGQFLIVKTDEFGERIPLTICDYDKEQEIINIVYQVSTPKLPLSVYADNSKFKICLLDTGLLGTMLNISSDIVIKPNELFAEYNGAFIENFVTSELISAGIRELFYWTSRSDAEVDFVIHYQNAIYPLEVKSGSSRNLKSIRSYESKYNPKFIFRTSQRNYVKENEFVNIPLYAAFSVQKIISVVTPS